MEHMLGTQIRMDFVLIIDEKDENVTSKKVDELPKREINVSFRVPFT